MAQRGRWWVGLILSMIVLGGVQAIASDGTLHRLAGVVVGLVALALLGLEGRARAAARAASERQLEAIGQRLDRQRRRNAAVLNVMDAAVILLDRQQRVRWLNMRAIEIFGVDDAVRRGRRPLIELTRHPAVLQVVRDRHGDRVEEFDLPGQRRRVLIARATDDETRDGTILVIQDVTKLRRLETIRRDFMANLGHELRTPIAVARAQGENLADGVLRDAEAVQRAGAAVVRAADRLGGMVADLSDLASIETGRAVGELVAVDLAEIAEQTAVALSPRAAEKNFTLVNSVAPGLRVRGDGHAVERLLINLVDNAIQNGADGGRVEVSAETVDGRVRIAVADDGPGVPEHLHDRIFERFFRSAGDRSPSYQGTGLGLAIVKHLVAAMEGELALDSAPGCGATFTVTLAAA